MAYRDWYAVVNFKGKTQNLNKTFNDRSKAVDYYKQVTAEYPHIEFKVWDGVYGFGCYNDDITKQVRQELGL